MTAHIQFPPTRAGLIVPVSFTSAAGHRFEFDCRFTFREDGHVRACEIATCDHHEDLVTTLTAGAAMISLLLQRGMSASDIAAALGGSMFAPMAVEAANLDRGAEFAGAAE